MTVAPPEPAQDPTMPGEAQPGSPQAPDLPDPAFPEVLPGGDPGPGEAPDPEPETQPAPS
ncbi:hypothetical protein [Aeromicrobium sp. A1-2]|uniref:hypothetical protein n=1 Tax=Aeromicrobium sp. A1-2 TaxID=2107713 RepID=UPI0013C2E9C5|nr:hypothetical protein [Aeromicrobium sp. A1-2]